MECDNAACCADILVSIDNIVVQARHAKALAEQQVRMAEEAKQKLAAAARRMQVPPISTASTASGGTPNLAMPSQQDGTGPQPVADLPCYGGSMHQVLPGPPQAGTHQSTADLCKMLGARRGLSHPASPGPSDLMFQADPGGS